MNALTDKWLSEIFGYPCYQLTGEGEPPAFLKCKRHGKCFAWARVGEIETVRGLLDFGFDSMSNSVTFSSDDNFSPSSEWGCWVERLESNSVFSVMAWDRMAAQFSHDRFHEDPKIPNEMAYKIKKRNIWDSLTDKNGKSVIVAKSRSGCLAGMLIYESRHKTIVIDHITTILPFKRRGFARAMIEYVVMCTGCWNNQKPIVQASTQVSNIGAVDFYSKLGMQYTGASYVLHFHGGEK
ncbi:MAG: GNAT family N-acetyltransferase [FCB group bacterium]|nr:GNAT family N-acetyltransferase [FCB group bacterium]